MVFRRRRLDDAAGFDFQPVVLTAFFFHEETGSFQGFPGQSRIPGGKSLCGTAAAFSRKSLETRIQNIDRISTDYRLYRQNINKLSTSMSIISADLKQTPSGQKLRGENSSERKPTGQKGSEARNRHEEEKDIKKQPRRTRPAMPPYDQFARRACPFSGLRLLSFRHWNGPIHRGQHGGETGI